MIRNIKEIEPNLDNLIVFSITSIDEDKIKLKQDSLSHYEDLKTRPL